MNTDPKVVRKVLLFALGASLGGVVGYFVGGLIVYKLNEKTNCLETEPEEENEEQKVADVPPVVIADSHTTDSLTEGAQKLKKNGAAKARTDYSKVAKSVNPPDATLEGLVSKYKTSLPAANGSSDPNLGVDPGPYVISGDTFTEDESFKKMSISFFNGDAMYADSNEKCIEDALQLLGNAHLHFGEMNEDPDVVYIRNENTSTDYEVIRIDGSYKVLVEGLEPEEPTEKPKKTTTKEKAEEAVRRAKANTRKVKRLDEQDGKDEESAD